MILNLEAVPEIDVTSLDLLEQLRSDLESAGTHLYLARVTDPVKDLFSLSGFGERLGEGRIFWGVDTAVDSYLKSTARSAGSSS